MTTDINLTIDGNPGASLRGTDEAEWEPGVATIKVERFIYNPESATEAQIEIAHDDLSGQATTTSVEVTYEDLIALRDALNTIIEDVVQDGRDDAPGDDIPDDGYLTPIGARGPDDPRDA